MASLVEDVGESLCAGWLSRFIRTTGQDCGAVQVGGREVHWKLGPTDAVTVAHSPPDATAQPVSYRIQLRYTELPSRGSRWWWSCPACRKRVDVLYLPSDRDRLACRRCCGLLYQSQYTGRKRRRRKRRPTTELIRERKVWTQATGWVLLSRTRVRRRT